MRPNFDISLPSIPGKSIKFKIQDIKSTAFGSQKSRFNDNKKGLTKKFIQSFNNFHQSKDQSRLQQQTQASQTASRITINNYSKGTFGNSQIKFHHIISDDKKHLISTYENYKQYQPPVLNQNKFQKGFTFNKAEKSLSHIKNQQELAEEQDSLNKFVTDNYYFTSTVLKTMKNKENTSDRFVQRKQMAQQQNKYIRPNAVFKSQPRQKVWDRIYKSEVPGPGFYITQQKKQQTTNKPKRTISLDHSPQHQNDYKKLKGLITSIVADESNIIPEQQQHADQKKKQKMQYIFIKDDRDRFGEQKYPIASRTNVPGPGSYEIMQGIQQQAKKVALVQQQRKLLKQWFNN